MTGWKESSSLSYALQGLIDLALHQRIGPVTVKSIAKRRGIPVRYLEQIFNRLRRKGIVAAERGPRGGYRLRKPPAKIRVSDVFRSLENGRARRPQKGSSDPAAQLWRQVESAVQATLHAATLQALIEQAGESVPSDVKHTYTFHI